MESRALTQTLGTNRNPAVDRAMVLLGELERNPAGISLNELTRRTNVSRSSAYRILNSLEKHGMVRVLRGGAYILGSRILELATHTAVGTRDFDLARIVQPHVDRAATKTGETAKVSVYDRGDVVVISGAPGTTPHALHTVVGRSLPLHAGAASKILLAHLPKSEIKRFLSFELRKITKLTLTSEAELMPELEKIKAQGWSYDPGEFSINVSSYGAPIYDKDGQLVAAISIPFGAGRDAAFHDHVRKTAIATVKAISADLKRQ